MVYGASDRLLTRRDVSSMVGFAQSTIYKKMAAGEFPRPIKVKSAARWSERDVAAWIEEQKALSEQAAA
ncbi:helix-turn-helix transcriptional regulator [Vannielia litorea]|uniref:helix-turn-helix transcriptional regulator n=1 Tax=Vannielia litorea TaxID=1217970 RepID=UPI001C96F790|nr:AlpA family phage regulatory protein [Vannielia litorea]MBY6048316.1 AlpA family phage regulatory protein [Vannielia litorea]MBY6075730.1 AlpA family phage regulatory protein [Vannielia litorea]